MRLAEDEVCFLQSKGEEKRKEMGVGEEGIGERGERETGHQTLCEVMKLNVAIEQTPSGEKQTTQEEEESGQKPKS